MAGTVLDGKVLAQHIEQTLSARVQRLQDLRTRCDANAGDHSGRERSRFGHVCTDETERL